MHKTLKYLLISVGILLSGALSAQVEVDTSENKSSAIKIYNSNFYEFRGDLDPPEEHYKGDVKMTHDSVYMFADTSILSLDFMNAVGNIVILQEDTIRLFADSLFYDTENGKAELFYNVVLENGKQQLFTERLDYYTETKIAVYPDTALLKNDRTQLSSLRGKYDMNAALATFAGEVIVLDKEFTLSADSLLYNTDLDKAIFVGPTNIDQENRKIYCESGYYDIQNGQALFEQNANYVEDDQEASAHQIKYNESTGEVTLIGNAKYKDAEKNASADLMVYDENTKDIVLTGNAFFNDGNQTATGDEIKYNEESGEVSIAGQAILESDDVRIVAANSQFDEARGVGVFEGDVVFESKKDSVTVFSDQMEVDNENKINIATGEDRPYMLRFIDGDSLFLSADTLYVQERIDSVFVIERIDSSIVEIVEEVKELEADTIKQDALEVLPKDLGKPEEGSKPEKGAKPEKGTKPKKGTKPEKGSKPKADVTMDEDKPESTEESQNAFGELRPAKLVLDTILSFVGFDTINVFKAYKDVRILSEEFQAVSDSMYYDTKDSLFVLFENPIMWSDSMQFTGDTIRIKLADKGVETVYLDGRAMINELIDGEHYNQLKAKRIEAWIDSSTISFMEMQQNAESNYYIMDEDDAFVGLNHTLCNRMNFFFEEGEMSDIKFFEKPTSVLTPMGKLTREQLFLKDFSWNLEMKPNSLEDLLKKKEIPQISSPENLEGAEGGSMDDESADGESEDSSRKLRPARGDVFKELEREEVPIKKKKNNR